MKVRKNHHEARLKYIFPYGTPGVPLEVEGEGRKLTSSVAGQEGGGPRLWPRSAPRSPGDKNDHARLNLLILKKSIVTGAWATSQGGAETRRRLGR